MSNTTMRAVLVREHGGFDALSQETIDAPTAGPGEVVVGVKACGINHLDLWVRRGVPGAKFPLPLILGSDAAGIVHEVGAGVDHISAGDEVIVAPGVSCGQCPACIGGRDHQCRGYGILGEHKNGGCAEFIKVPAVNIVKKPANLSFAEAAAVGIPFLTAWHMLVDRARVRPGENVLIQGAGSGVSIAAMQIAKLYGARVIVTSRTDDKLKRAEALGADVLLNSSTQDVAKEIANLTDRQGVEVVIEHVGQATWKTSVRSLAWHGRLVTCGATTGAEVPLNLRHLFFKAQSFLGSTMGSKGEFIEVLDHVARGSLKPVVDRALPLADIAEAHRALEAGEIFGKVVLEP